LAAAAVLLQETETHLGVGTLGMVAEMAEMVGIEIAAQQRLVAAAVRGDILVVEVMVVTLLLHQAL
jgi:hypothetical protein